MKAIILRTVLFFSLAGLSFSCGKDVLEEELYSDLAANNFLATEEGINSVLNSAYDVIQQHGQAYEMRILTSMMSSGIGTGAGGSFEQVHAVPWQNFTWDINSRRIRDFWNIEYEAIRNANIILDNIENESFSPDFKSKIAAEAKAIRGYAYGHLYNLFGTVPIHTTANTSDFQLARATDEEMLDRIETDLSEAAAVLPLQQAQYGRMTKGMALAILCKHYLNTKQWAESETAARQIIELNTYHLLPVYKDIFAVENEGNSEIIMPQPSVPTPSSSANNFTALTTPADFPLLPNQGTYAARAYILDSFIDLFEPSDTRQEVFVRSYVNKNGVTIAGYGVNKSICLKYPPDPNANGFSYGTDLVDLRYADILLSLAEAINEQEGPTQEAIDLINLIRERAHASLLDLGDYDKDSLRDRILLERRMELFWEDKEREDLIRHGKFVSYAQARGKNADDHHNLYPIPSLEMNANAKMVQNPGY